MWHNKLYWYNGLKLPLSSSEYYKTENDKIVEQLSVLKSIQRIHSKNLEKPIKTGLLGLEMTHSQFQSLLKIQEENQDLDGFLKKRIYE